MKYYRIEYTNDRKIKGEIVSAIKGCLNKKEEHIYYETDMILGRSNEKLPESNQIQFPEMITYRESKIIDVLKVSIKSFLISNVLYNILHQLNIGEHKFYPISIYDWTKKIK